MFNNVVLMKIFGIKRDKVIGELRRLHNEGFYDLYSSPNITCVHAGDKFVELLLCQV